MLDMPEPVEPDGKSRAFRWAIHACFMMTGKAILLPLHLAGKGAQR